MAESTVKTYTLAEVAQRDGRAGAPMWMVYKDSVYDVTNYANEHPGGVESIVEEAGTDATKAFDQSGHTSDAREIMKKLKIGEIVEEEKKYDANGKKKKRVVKAAPEGESSRSCLNVVTCGLIG
ncbi:cytochrome b5-like [Plodia interpunctella]|uniref:cytochrome b5-like n=1 Tax=Plodia interpunctella TaxID=58824 RepID=UPI002367E1BF|nr:cytochrome b5-like [Plodia interpunctella]